VRDTLTADCLYPTRLYAEDIEFNHLLEEKNFLVFKCNKFVCSKVMMKSLASAKQPHDQELQQLDETLAKLNLRRIEAANAQAEKENNFIWAFGYLSPLPHFEKTSHIQCSVPALDKLSHQLQANCCVVVDKGVHYPSSLKYETNLFVGAMRSKYGALASHTYYPTRVIKRKLISLKLGSYLQEIVLEVPTYDILRNEVKKDVPQFDTIYKMRKVQRRHQTDPTTEEVEVAAIAPIEITRDTDLSVVLNDYDVIYAV